MSIRCSCARRGAGADLGSRLSDLADRLEWAGSQSGRLRDAAGDRGLRPLGLATLTWFSWSRELAERPPATPGRSVDVYVCTYDESAEVVLATLAGCRALTYPHTTWLLDDGRPPGDAGAGRAGRGPLPDARPDNSHAKAGNINAALTAHRGGAGPDARRRPRPNAGRPRRDGRLLRRRADGAWSRARTTSSTTTRSSTTSSVAMSNRSFTG